MKKELTKISFLLMILLSMAHVAMAQYGKLKGTITDASTGDPLPGAQVFIEGTTLGAATDINGEYIIIGVRPGTYSVEARFIGYQSVKKTGVRVNIDLTQEVNFALPEETVQLGDGEVLEVVASREMIQKDLTASTSVVGRDEIAAIPVDNFNDVIELQAGVVNGHFRGGRTGEVAYMIDGVPVNDVFDGSSSVQVENNQVEEVQVITGAFNAEFGQAMSGVVNVVTRNGSNKLSGGFNGFIGDYGSNDTALFTNIDELNPTSVANGEFDLSGPLVKNKLYFFTSGRYFQNKGWLYGKDVFGFDDVGYDAQGRLSLIDTLGSGSGKLVAMNPYERIGGQLKLTWQIARGLTLSVNGILSQEEFKGYNHGLRFMPIAQRNEQRKGQTYFVKATHVFSDRTFYEVGVTRNYSEYLSALFDDPLDSAYRRNEFYGFRSPLLTSNFAIGGTDNGRFKRSTETYLIKGDITSQMNKRNLVKGGIEFRLHDLFLQDASVAVLGEPSDTTFVVINDEYTVTPIEAAAYVQDKIEIGSLIINAGLRLDYFDAKGNILEDPTDQGILFGEPILKDTEPTWQISPRLGVAFPITERGVIHFSYGHFFQTPNLSLLYQNSLFRLGSGGSGLIGLLGNAGLKPQQTINGEIGLKQQLTESTALEATAFFRDIRGLAGSGGAVFVVNGTSARYAVLDNSDFGFVRGFVFRFDQRVGNSVSINADYTFQLAKGNSSDPAQIFNAAAAKQQLETQIVPLNWDQRHTANVSISYASAKRWGFGILTSYGSGLPYTPDEGARLTGGVIAPGTIPLNSEIKPSTFLADFKAYKDISLGNTNLQLSLRVDNVFDTRNEYGIFNDTGRATYSLYRNIDARTFIGDESYLNSWYSRPDFYGEPRRVVFGAAFRF